MVRSRMVRHPNRQRKHPMEETPVAQQFRSGTETVPHGQARLQPHQPELIRPNRLPRFLPLHPEVALIITTDSRLFLQVHTAFQTDQSSLGDQTCPSLLAYQPIDTDLLAMIDQHNLRGTHVTIERAVNPVIIVNRILTLLIRETCANLIMAATAGITDHPRTHDRSDLVTSLRLSDGPSPTCVIRDGYQGETWQDQQRFLRGGMNRPPLPNGRAVSLVNVHLLVVMIRDRLEMHASPEMAGKREKLGIMPPLRRHLLRRHPRKRPSPLSTQIVQDYSPRLRTSTLLGLRSSTTPETHRLGSPHPVQTLGTRVATDRLGPSHQGRRTTTQHLVVHSQTNPATIATADIATQTITYPAVMAIRIILRLTHVKSGTRSEKMGEQRQCEMLSLVRNQVVVRRLITEGLASRIPITVG